MKWIVRETTGKKWVIDKETYETITKDLSKGAKTITITLKDGSIKFINKSDIDGIWKGEEK